MNFESLIEKVKHIPYGRTSSRSDFSLVLTENKGTCSSKHAFLKDFSNQNKIENVKLFIGIYKMNEQNTKIGSILAENNIKYIPEAHCYLSIDNQYVDVTSKDSDFEKLRKDILEEIEIEPFQVVDFKVNYHKEFLKKWLIENNIKFTFDEIWTIREQCIANLSN